MISLRSKITQKVLAFVFLQNEEFYANELARRLEVDPGNLIRKLHELEKSGLLTSQTKGQEKYYKLNIKFPLLKEYKSIVQKTVGFEHQLRKCLQSINGIEKALLFGSYAKNKMDESSDIDLLVVGEHKILNLQRKIVELQNNFDREINVISMDKKEFQKKKNKDPFLIKVLKSTRVDII